jgi:hypothetical protein
VKLGRLCNRWRNVDNADVGVTSLATARLAYELLEPWSMTLRHVLDGFAKHACVEGGGSSWAVTRLHTMIGLTGYRTRDLMCIRRTLYRLTKNA